MDIISRLERIPAGRFHYQLLLLTGLGWMFDAMDTGIIAFVLPVLARKWGLTPAQVGYIGSMGLVGMALGAVLAGSLADRFGRKKVFAATLVFYSIATGLCGVAWNYTVLLLFRFLVGFGLGGQLPVAVTLVSEYAPAGKRGRFIVLLESFWAVGWLAAALISYLLIPRYGWQAAFLIGALPALYVFHIGKKVPESVRYLLEKGQVAAAHQLVSKLEEESGLAVAEAAIVPEKAAKFRPAFQDIWTKGLAPRTVMLWILWFGIVYTYYGIFIWLPSLMAGQGITILKTFQYLLIMTLAQLPGYYSAAYLVERVGRKATLAAYLLLSALCAWFFGQGGSVVSILFWGSMMSFFNLGAWGVVYTYTPELYPTRIRAFGSGWAAAVGRIGGILAPIFVGYMVSARSGFMNVFIMFTVVMVLIAGAVWFLGEETKGKLLDEISR
ncbi:sugar transport proteins signature 1 [Lucifera butyrica]|uniref:Sugar transport proteins signature 1 n=1 Tax=Lucifera butyrica TaxID=1351585 RepID=A0A498R401_9FIRM|nr:MFS transporter [Lucifera butyrica]VBB07406.1 sugar transport proteins signature 1 [Lucifera butyrica]